MLSKNKHAENSNSCTWFYNLDIHTNGMSHYRLHRSISGPRIYPGHSRYFHPLVELYHTTDATALSATECLLKHFGRFGAPHQLRSDNGIGAGAVQTSKRVYKVVIGL